MRNSIYNKSKKSRNVQNQKQKEILQRKKEEVPIQDNQESNIKFYNSTPFFLAKKKNMIKLSSLEIG